MNINLILDKLFSDIENLRCITLMGYDGIKVLEKSHEKLDASDEQHLMYLKLFKNIQDNLFQMRSNEANQVTIKMLDKLVWFESVNSDYLIVLVLENGINYGKTRYLLKKWLPEIQKDI